MPPQKPHTIFIISFLFGCNYDIREFFGGADCSSVRSVKVKHLPHFCFTSILWMCCRAVWSSTYPKKSSSCNIVTCGFTRYTCFRNCYRRICSNAKSITSRSRRDAFKGGCSVPLLSANLPGGELRLRLAASTIVTYSCPSLVSMLNVTFRKPTIYN